MNKPSTMIVRKNINGFGDEYCNVECISDGMRSVLCRIHPSEMCPEHGFNSETLANKFAAIAQHDNPIIIGDDDLTKINTLIGYCESWVNNPMCCTPHELAGVVAEANEWYKKLIHQQI